MDSLDAVATQVRQRIGSFRDLPDAIGESNTKASLIEPVLQALGWDVHDPTEVHREWRGRGADNPVDYGLLINGSPVLLIEAKGLGENIGDPRWANQVIGYAAVSGVRWVALTDGDTWHIYNAGIPLPTEKKHFQAATIAGDLTAAVGTLELLQRTPDLAKRLDSLWAVGQRDRSIRQAIESLFSPHHRDDLVQALGSFTTGISDDEVSAGLDRVQIEVTMGGVSSERTSADPMPDEVPGPTRGSAKKATRRPKMSDTEKRITLREMVDAGVVKPGQQLVARYLGQTFEASVGAAGDVIFDGASYSPSGAGRAAKLVAQPDASESTLATQGMDFWSVLGEGGDRDRKLLAIRAELANRR
jgi:predicted type IV restriction endonuclease